MLTQAGQRWTVRDTLDLSSPVRVLERLRRVHPTTLAGLPAAVCSRTVEGAIVIDQTARPGYGPASIWQQSRPSPISDLIKEHRAEMAKIWQRHAAELARQDDRAA
jgi:hypothetical protein